MWWFKKKIEYGTKDDQYYCTEEVDKNNKSHGKMEVYLSGIKALEMNYKHGKFNGKNKEFNKDGIKISEANYKNGKLNGVVAYYDDCGNKISEFVYRSNKLIEHDS